MLWPRSSPAQGDWPPVAVPLCAPAGLLPGLARPCHARRAVLAAGWVAFLQAVVSPGAARSRGFCRHSQGVYCLLLRASALLTSRLEAEPPAAQHGSRRRACAPAAPPVPAAGPPARPSPRPGAVPGHPRGPPAPVGRLCHGALAGAVRVPRQLPVALGCSPAFLCGFFFFCGAIYFFAVLTQVRGYLRVLFLCHLKFRRDFLQNSPF